MINKERIVDRFLNYVKISSESLNEKNFSEHLSRELVALGFSVMMDKTGDIIGGNCGNIIAKLKGTKSGEPILLSAHMDTVCPGMDIKPIIKDEVIYSDGTTVLGGDDKAGIACIVEGVQSILESGVLYPDIELVFTVAEEIGIKGGKNLDLNLITAREGFILDSSKLPGEIITQSPGQAKIKVKIHGKAAHAGVCPEDGISAVQIFADAVQQMKLLRIDEETTANIGIVKGGTATNIVMPELDVTAEVRSLSLEKIKIQVEHMKDCFNSAALKYKSTVDFESELMYGAFNVKEDAAVVLKAKKAFEALEIKATTTMTGGGSDANALNSRGLTMINLGIGEKKAHTLDEHYYIRDLLLMSEFVSVLIRD